MEPIIIPFPTITKHFNKSFSDLKENCREVISKFPNDYKLIDEDSNRITILITTIFNQYPNIAHDILLRISQALEGIKFEIFNETGKISSYNEAERGNYAMTTFISWIDKSIDGKLDKAASILNINKGIQKFDKENGIRYIYSLIFLIALFTIIFKSCN